jgi:hypothetical protein
MLATGSTISDKASDESTAATSSSDIQRRLAEMRQQELRLQLLERQAQRDQLNLIASHRSASGSIGSTPTSLSSALSMGGASTTMFPLPSPTDLEKKGDWPPRLG